jgi:F-type H+-transporting ATPase subunit alpha
VSIWLGTTGQLDDVPLDDVRRFEQEFLDFVQRTHDGIFDAIRETGALSDDTTTALKDATEEFRRTFEVSGGGLLETDDGAEGQAEVEQDKIQRHVDAPPETKNA